MLATTRRKMALHDTTSSERDQYKTVAMNLYCYQFR